MTLSPAGVLSGTPTTAVSFNFTVKATDSNGCMGTKPYTLTIDTGILARLQFYPLPATVRLLDTRPGENACFTPGSSLGNDAVRMQQATGVFTGIQASSVAIVGNATVVNFIYSHASIHFIVDLTGYFSR